MSIYIHPSADVSPKASIGEDTRVWHQAQVREGATVGSRCVIGKGVYIDVGVHIGNNVKIQNGVSIYRGVILDDGVFCGPGAVFTNDLYPRSINPDGSPRTASDWTVTDTHVGIGASIGANATIVCGVTIGPWAMVGAGSVVSRSVPAHGLVVGNPARLIGMVCACGARFRAERMREDLVHLVCSRCHAELDVSAQTWLPSEGQGERG